MTSWRMTRLTRTVSIAGAILVVAAGLYTLLVRPWHLRWGANQLELNTVLPGDHLVHRPTTISTRAITIACPADRVFELLSKRSPAAPFQEIERKPGRYILYSAGSRTRILYLFPIGFSSTRLVIRSRDKPGDLIWSRLFREPRDFFNQRRVLEEIRERAELDRNGKT
jgi:hypothetical protein